MNRNWQSAVVRRLVLLLGACLLLGLVTDQMTLCLLLGVSGYLVWTLIQMFRLGRWLEASEFSEHEPPTSRGLWGAIFDNIYRLQRRQQKSRRRLQAVIDRVQASTGALSDAIVMVNSHGCIEWWNPAAEQLLGFRSPDDQGQHITNLIRDPRFIRYFEQKSYNEPLELPSPVIESIRLQYSITLYGTNNRLVVVRNITRLHQLEVMRKDFVANVSHELRTPLTVITGYLETMQDGLELMPDKAPPVWKRALTQMLTQAERMQNIISDLLTLSRLETSDSQLDQNSVNIHELLDTVVHDALAYSHGKHKVKLDCPDHACLTGNREELRSAFSNLVYNAVKYTPEGGDIKVRWLENSYGATLQVKDNGIGIDPQHLPRLTERFYRVDKGRHSQTGGTGLGLAIVKHVLLRHNAVLDVSSKPGKGSTFSCRFPAVRRECA